MKQFFPRVLIALAFTASPFSPDAHSSELGKKDQGIYATLGAGYLHTQNLSFSNSFFDVDPGFSFDSGFGYRFNPNLRAEVTYLTSKYVISSSNLFDDIISNSVFLSGYYDIIYESKLTPYIGLGVGSTTVDSDATTDDNDTALSYQGKAGLAFDASEKVDVFGEVAYQLIRATNIANTDIEDTFSWRGQLGIRFFF